MGKFDSFATLALNLIDKYGTTAVVTPGTVTYDPVTQEATPTGDPMTVQCIVKPSSRRSGFHAGGVASGSEALIGGTLERNSAFEFLIAMKNLPSVPEAGSNLTVGGKTYKIVAVDVINPAADGPIVATCYGQV